MKKAMACLLAVVLCSLTFGVFAVADDDVVEIVWLAPGSEADYTEAGKYSYECIKAYHESQDKVRVKVEFYPNQADLFDVIQMKFSAGTSEYDVLSIDAPMASGYVNNGWLLPLDEYITEADTADFTDSANISAHFDGHLYAPALQDSSLILCWNTDLLKEAGIEIRENDVNNRLTWEEVSDYAKKAISTIDADGARGITGIEFNQVGRVYEMNILANSLGGAQIGEDGFSLDGVLNSEPWMKALTWYQEQVNAGIFSRGIKPAEAPNNFYSDKVLFYVTTVAAMNTIKKNIDHFDYSYIPCFAGYEDQVATACGSWNIGVNVNSKHAAEAADFVKFMTLGTGNDVRFEYSSQLPARKSLLEKMAADEGTERFMKIAAYEAMNTAVNRAKTPAYNQYNAIMDALWDNVRNNVNVAEAVQGAIDEMNVVAKSFAE